MNAECRLWAGQRKTQIKKRFVRHVPIQSVWEGGSMSALGAGADVGEQAIDVGLVPEGIIGLDLI